MINKVKPPNTLKLVRSSKEAKNDLGGQSAESYSKDSKPKEAQPEAKNEAPKDAQSEDKKEEGSGEAANIGDQVGLTNVVKEWLEEGKAENGISRQKVSQRYQGESAPAKGMLLNKKIS